MPKARTSPLPTGIQALNNLAEGRTSPEIAHLLDVSSNTVEDWYVTSLQTKLKARTATMRWLLPSDWG